jgi:hypothetical protein
MTLENTTLGSTDLLASGRTRLYFIHHLSLASLSQLLTSRFGLITILIAILATQYARSPWRRVPPGPKGLPILGNALQLMDKSWMFERVCKRNFGAINSIVTDSVISQAYQRNPRTYDVFKCPWPAYSRFE